MKNRSKRLKAAVFQGHTVDLYRCSSMFVCINLGVGKSEVAVSARSTCAKHLREAPSQRGDWQEAG